MQLVGPTLLVVPCFNEAARLRTRQFLDALDADPNLHLLLVDDGSTDDTLACLRALADRAPARMSTLALPQNVGKGEAVRAGLREGLKQGPAAIGYWDADLATPFDVAPQFRAVLEAHPDVHLVMGSRIRMLGADIRRSPARHYAGRLVATLTARFLKLPVYDTQCGAKLFRVSEHLAEVFARPFISRWLFDVELLARMQTRAAQGAPLGPYQAVREVPLATWRDEEGSKVRSRDFFFALRDLRRMKRTYPPRTRRFAAPDGGRIPRPVRAEATPGAGGATPLPPHAGPQGATSSEG